MHPDFQKVYNNFIKQYGPSKGKNVYYSWLNKNKLDDKKPMPKGFSPKSEKEIYAEVIGGSVSFYTTPSIQILEAEGKKFVRLSGILMNTKYNANSWRVGSSELQNVANTVSGTAIKIQHSYSDWEIVGTGKSGIVEGSEVKYSLDITDPKAVEKFETKTWNSENMGVSPSLDFQSVTCTICDETIMKGEEHKHMMGATYKDKLCQYDVHGVSTKEISLTSNPAYAPAGAGTIDNITPFFASLSKILNDGVRAEKGDSMEEDMVNKLLAEKEEKISTLTAQTEESKKSIEASKKEVEALKAETDSVKKELDASKKEAESVKAEFIKVKAELDDYVTKERTAELEKRVTDKEIIAEIVGKKLSKEEFGAEIKKIDKLILSTKSNVGAGSAPIDPSASKKTPDQEFEAEWGMKEIDLLKDVVGGGRGD
jgi:archaellum component FlaC